MTPISRGFGRRQRPEADPSRVPPGQYVVRDFPVLSAGPTPHTPLEDWSLTIEGAVDAAVSWSWEEFLALPQADDVSECLDPVRDVVVPFQAAPETAAGIVLKHLVKLGIISRSKAEDYLRLPGPRAADRAEQILADRRTRARERKESKERAGQPAEPIEGNGQGAERPLTLW